MAVSSVRIPIFFSFLWSDLVNFVLSHPEAFFFAAGAASVAAAQVTCFDLVIEGAGSGVVRECSERVKCARAASMVRAGAQRRKKANG